MREGPILGYDEAGEGPILLLLHAYPLDRRMWERQLEALAGIRRVVAVDLRGRGKSAGGAEPSVGWTMDDLADDVARTVPALGADRADFAGISMGGYVLFALWRRHASLVRSLALIDTRSEPDAPERRAARDQVAALARERGTAALLEQMLPQLVAPSSVPALRGRLAVMFEEMPGETAAADAIALRDRPDSTPDLATITVPALVVHGEQDRLAPIEGAEAMARAIPGGRLVRVPGAGHLSPMEEPDAVNRALREFLEGISP